MGTDARLARMLEERYPDPTVSAAHLDRGTEISIGPARPWSRVEEDGDMELAENHLLGPDPELTEEMSALHEQAFLRG